MMHRINSSVVHRRCYPPVAPPENSQGNEIARFADFILCILAGGDGQGRGGDDGDAVEGEEEEWEEDFQKLSPKISIALGESSGTSSLDPHDRQIPCVLLDRHRE